MRSSQKFTEHWEINPGFIDLVFKVLTLNDCIMSPKSKECVLCVDEISYSFFLL